MSRKKKLIGDFDGENTVVMCPTCGFECTHMGMVTVKQGERIDVVTRSETIRRENGATIEPFERGAIVTILMWCEQSHVFEWKMQFHKGSTFVSSSPVSGEDATHQEELWRE